MPVAALMRVLSVVLVVYHALALEVRCRSVTEASCCLPLEDTLERLHCLPSVVPCQFVDSWSCLGYIKELVK